MMKARVQRWTIQFPEVQKEIDEIQQAMESYALAHSVQPDRSVKEKILQQLSDGSQEINSYTATPKKAPVYAIPGYFKRAVAAGLILLTGSLIISYIYYDKYRSVSANFRVVQNELNKQREIAAGINKDINVITDKNSVPVVLKGTPHAPDAVAKIFWMKNTGEVYVDAGNLPQPVAGETIPAMGDCGR